ncbi:integumentary mucin A.1-like [Homarus americanus]|uniref:integumentary mucin A.1-like n=1 Tax=Homarus americanus TaxID=6706 RepID=UPI001C44CBAE|nr:integumentary mucin A.1-like [Homarus americanus]
MGRTVWVAIWLVWVAAVAQGEWTNDQYQMRRTGLCGPVLTTLLLTSDVVCAIFCSREPQCEGFSVGVDTSLSCLLHSRNDVVSGLSHLCYLKEVSITVPSPSRDPDTTAASSITTAAPGSLMVTTVSASAITVPVNSDSLTTVVTVTTDTSSTTVLGPETSSSPPSPLTTVVPTQSTPISGDESPTISATLTTTLPASTIINTTSSLNGTASTNSLVSQNKQPLLMS